MAEPEKTKSRAKQSIDFPLILLGVLLTIVAVLIFIGYDYLRDEAPNAPAIVVNTPEANAPAEKKEESIEKVAVKNDNERPKKNEKIEKKASSTLPAPVKKETSKAPLPEGKTITHLVKTGETFSAVARRYHLSDQTLKSLNPGIKETDVKANVTKLKIRIKAVHTVGPGDVLSKVAAKYGVSKTLIMAANGKTKDYAARGETLIIPLP